MCSMSAITSSLLCLFGYEQNSLIEMLWVCLVHVCNEYECDIISQ